MSSPSYNVTTNHNLLEWLSLYNDFVDDYDTFGVKTTGNTGSILTPVGTEAVHPLGGVKVLLLKLKLPPVGVVGVLVALL